MTHHDVALVENPNLPPPPAEWMLFGAPQAINHVAMRGQLASSSPKRHQDCQRRGFFALQDG